MMTVPRLIAAAARRAPTVALALLLALLAAAAAHAAAVDSKVSLDKPVVLLGDTGPIFVLVRFAAPEVAPTAERPRLNLALVLDRSGSMGRRGKLATLKRAAKMVVDSLQRDDRLAIVEYDDRVTVMWPSAPVESPEMIKRLIDGLTPRASTDLAGGILRGIAEVQAHLKEGELNRVLLLSDGLANVGVTSPREIRRLVRDRTRRGVRVSTMGLGLEYNEDLMQDIADSAGGNYYYIEHPDQMAGIFGRELKALFRTAARDVGLASAVASQVRGVEVFGFAAESSGGETRVELADFYAGESRALLFRLEVAPEAVGRLRLGTLRFSYHDVEADARRRFETEVVIDVSSDETAVQEAANQDVIVEAALVEAERQHEEAVALFKSGRYADAGQRLEALARSLAESNEGRGDVRIAKKIEALQLERERMEEIAAAPDSKAVSAYSKATKQRLHQARKGKRGLYMVRLGDSGYEVERLQKALAAAGYYSGPIDGRFDRDVADSLKRFQADKGLVVDGIAGPATLQRLGLY